MESNLAYIEVLLGNCISCMQFLSIWCGFPLLILFWIPKVTGAPQYCLKVFLLGLGLVVYGAVVPGFLGLMLNQGQDVFLLEAIVSPAVTLVGLVACLGASFLPTIIAVREKRENKVWIIMMNCFFLIPICWLGSFIWACVPDKTPEALARSDVRGEPSPPVSEGIADNAEPPPADRMSAQLAEAQTSSEPAEAQTSSESAETQTSTKLAEAQTSSQPAAAQTSSESAEAATSPEPKASPESADAQALAAPAEAEAKIDADPDQPIG